jgi:hypothetical protein
MKNPLSPEKNLKTTGSLWSFLLRRTQESFPINPMAKANSSFLACINFLIGAAAILISTSAHADILFDQMTNYSTTGLVLSSWFPPNGFDSDTYSYDNFRLSSNSTINEVWWVGGNGLGPAYGSISGVTVRFYTGLAGAPNSQPTITALPENETSADYLAGYTFSGNANETAIPGTSLFQYHVVLPTSLSLAGNTTFWIKIEGDSVNQFDGWGLAAANPGIDSYHVNYVTGRASFLPASGSEAFQLLGTAVPEPSTWAMLMGGCVTLLAFRRRQ